jgi:hypothetical protein
LAGIWQSISIITCTKLLAVPWLRINGFLYNLLYLQNNYSFYKKILCAQNYQGHLSIYYF